MSKEINLDERCDRILSLLAIHHTLNIYEIMRKSKLSRDAVNTILELLLFTHEIKQIDGRKISEKRYEIYD